ncbi:MAG: YggT family protein [Clostridiales Family XIII bacterium]|nr:YggT family protein [Clostridiales Family XIII bacterium]
MFDYCVSLIVNILMWILIAQAILSWFVNPYRGSASRALTSIYNGLSSFTYPLTRPARAVLAKINTGPMDFSLLLTVLFLILIREILIRLI